MVVSRNYYDLLGVPSSVDSFQLRKAFRRLSKALHPDTTALPPGEAARRFQEVCEAYELLADPITRAAYDKQLAKENLDIQSYQNEASQMSETRRISYKTINKEVRRPFSGGELFSLLLLSIALITSLLLAFGFGLLNGKELQFRPTWLQTDQLSLLASVQQIDDVSVASSQDSFEQAFIDGFGELVIRDWGYKIHPKWLHLELTSSSMVYEDRDATR